MNRQDVSYGMRSWGIYLLSYILNREIYVKMSSTTIAIGTAMSTMVTIDAPTTSPVVTFVVVEELPSLSLSPAVGSLVLFPPVVDVTGAPEVFSPIIFAAKILVTLICSSSPLQPSQVELCHTTPQLLLLCPVQVSAAATPEPWSLGIIVLYVDGTSRAVKANHMERSPLKMISLLLQTSVVSQV